MTELPGIIATYDPNPYQQHDYIITPSTYNRLPSTNDLDVSLWPTRRFEVPSRPLSCNATHQTPSQHLRPIAGSSCRQRSSNGWSQRHSKHSTAHQPPFQRPATFRRPLTMQRRNPSRLDASNILLTQQSTQTITTKSHQTAERQTTQR